MKSFEFEERPKYVVNQPERWVQIRTINRLQSRRFLEAQFRDIERDFRYNGMMSYLDKFFHESRSICEKYDYTRSCFYGNVLDVLRSVGED